MEKRKIKLEDLEVAEATIKEGDYQTKQDLDSVRFQLCLSSNNVLDIFIFRATGMFH